MKNIIAVIASTFALSSFAAEPAKTPATPAAAPTATAPAAAPTATAPAATPAVAAPAKKDHKEAKKADTKSQAAPAAKAETPKK